jgi:hypothetical protein|tara:strand:+ start:32 stop:334 length:303 start_codon:yes stop_codon:yes gene_type:complete
MKNLEGLIDQYIAVAIQNSYDDQFDGHQGMATVEIHETLMDQMLFPINGNLDMISGKIKEKLKSFFSDKNFSYELLPQFSMKVKNSKYIFSYAIMNVANY